MGSYSLTIVSVGRSNVIAFLWSGRTSPFINFRGMEWMGHLFHALCC